MANIPNSIGLTGPIAPLDDRDTYPTHFSQYGAGGLLAVDTVESLSSLSALRLGNGEPLVYVRATGEWWQYINNSWVLATFNSILKPESVESDGDVVVSFIQGYPSWYLDDNSFLDFQFTA
jgi:hypothetical protein